MVFMIKPNRHAWLWWVSAVSFSIGIAIYILLKPAVYDLDIQRYRSMALVVSVLISGLCIIIGTSKRWFGKDL
jgi:hypothetical protein